MTARSTIPPLQGLLPLALLLANLRQLVQGCKNQSEAVLGGRIFHGALQVR